MPLHPLGLHDPKSQLPPLVLRSTHVCKAFLVSSGPAAGLRVSKFPGRYLAALEPLEEIVFNNQLGPEVLSF